MNASSVARVIDAHTPTGSGGDITCWCEERFESWAEHSMHVASAVLAAQEPELEREREQWQKLINDWADAYAKQGRELDRFKALELREETATIPVWVLNDPPEIDDRMVIPVPKQHLEWIPKRRWVSSWTSGSGQ